ncbi:cobyrinic acid a,c-diamide synthase [Asanoa ferruginea]|uniref:Cobyrinic acid a,c-diamide synthase n=1 Tax=Asanoa ferruginea TaxID=53367 RepID=A0A3D9ZEZ7_9ACTN|nr:cobyrinate a,c-diamide synthase [Asanoa ferruginea]REF94423.1 cobyrinic acid a,c-diamide synthase [Asanoa ferruginea]GIF52241.1 hypothetical protein Afe04nite_67800 [Asanoa ferruginea]
MSAVPRVVVSAPSSGHGKTALAVGLLAAFAGRGLSAVGFKVGPDHTDAAYLGAAAGSHGRNLDPRLVGAHRVAPLFAHGAEGHDIAVVEGTMGLFDSLAGRVETDSTAGVAAALRAPVVMVVDVGAMGQSVAALVHGFRAYDELTWLGGVILNRVASDRHEQLLREALDDIGVPVYGALRRRDLPSALPPRQEGVVPVVHREVEALRGIRRLGESIAGAVDLDGLLALANSAPQLPVTPWSPASELALHPDDTAAVHLGRRPIVALAGGPGLSFSYAETRELLEAAGATVVTFDPLRDELLPESTDALVVGGALPEAYAEDLSANRRLCADIADLARSGRPVIAEGAGLLWLAQSFDGRPMCGVLDATGTTGDQMIVGYRDATARATTAVAEVGTRVVGYKQHRGVVSPRAGQTPAWTWNGGTPEGFVWRRVHASQLSLHWAGFPEIARRLILAARPGEAPGPGGGGGSWARATGTVPVLAPGRPAAPASGGGAWSGATDSGEGTWPGATEPVPVVGVPTVPGGPRPASGPGAPTSGDGARAESAASDDGGWFGSRAPARDGRPEAAPAAGRDARSAAGASENSAWSGAPGSGADGRPVPGSGADGRAMPGSGADGRPMPGSGADGRPMPGSGADGRPVRGSGGDGRPMPASGADGRSMPGSGGDGRPVPGSGSDGRPVPGSGGDGQSMPASGGGALDYGTGARPADGFAAETDGPTDGRGFAVPGPPQLRSVPVPADGDVGEPPPAAPRLRAVPGSGVPQPAEPGTDGGQGFPPAGPPRLRVVPPLPDEVPPGPPEVAPPGGPAGRGGVDRPRDERESAARGGPGGPRDGNGQSTTGRAFAPPVTAPGHHDDAGQGTAGRRFGPPARKGRADESAGYPADGRGFAPPVTPPGHHDGAGQTTAGRESAAQGGPGGSRDGAGPATGRGFAPPATAPGNRDAAGRGTDGRGFPPPIAPPGRQDTAGRATDGRGHTPPVTPPGPHDGAGRATDGRGHTPPVTPPGRQDTAGRATDGRGFTPPFAHPGRQDGVGYAADAQGFAPAAGSGSYYDDDDQYVTDGFGFAAMPGARAGEPLGDGFVYVVPMGTQPPPGEAYRPPDQRQPPAEPARPGEFGFPVGRGDRADHPAPSGGVNPAWPAGQPAPGQGGERFAGRAEAGGALTGGTAELPARALEKPAAGRKRDDDDDDGGIT